VGSAAAEGQKQDLAKTYCAAYLSDPQSTFRSVALLWVAITAEINR